MTTKEDEKKDSSKNESPAASSLEVIEKAINDFKRSVEITRDVRFQANLRLASRQRLSSYIISLLSLYVIALSLLPNIIDLNQQKSQILLALSIILSVFVIFTSLLDGSQNFYHQGELLHQCARKIATVHYDLKNIDVTAGLDSAKQELAKIQKTYQNALDECPINHENVDFVKEQVRKPHLFPKDYNWKSKSAQRFYKHVYSILATYLWMFPHLVALLAVSVIVYQFILAPQG